MKKWALLSLLCASMFVIVIDTTIMNVSISALVEDLQTSVGGVQSAISIYALVMASFILIGGKLADVLGKKRTFIIGIVLFGIGTGIASLAQSLGVLIIGWSVLEGLGSALMLPNIQMLLREKYEGRDRAVAYGIIGAVGAVGAAVGPIAGGALTTYASWRWAFRSEVFVVVLVLIYSSYIQRDLSSKKARNFDILGALLTIAGLVPIVLGILLGRVYGFWLSRKPFVVGDLELSPMGLSVAPLIIASGVLVVLMLFSWEKHLENRDRNPLFKPSLFQTSGLQPGFLVRLVQMAVISGFLFIFPLLLQLSFEYNAMQTGVTLIPFSITLLIAAVLGSRLSSRFSAKRIIQAGIVLSIGGLAGLVVTLKPDISPSDLAKGAMFGAGIGLIASQILNLVLSSVGPEDTAEIAGVNGVFEQLGNALGVALIGTIMLGSLSANLEHSIESSDLIPPKVEAQCIAAVDRGVDLISNTELQERLRAAGVEPSVENEIHRIYETSRTQSFRSGVALLLFLMLVGLVLTGGLSNKKMVEEDVADPESPND